MQVMDEMKVKSLINLMVALEKICNEFTFSKELRQQARRDIDAVISKLATYGLFFRVVEEHGTISTDSALDRNLED